MNDQQYRSDKRIAQSDLVKIKRSPAFYKFSKDTDVGEKTSAMIFGSAVHEYILQKESFFDDYFITKKIRRAGKEWDAIVDQSKGKEILFDDELDKIVEIHSKIINHKMASALLYKEKCLKEEIVFWENLGLDLKSKIDVIRLTDKSNIIIDIKTTTDANYSVFCNKFYEYNYHIQAAFYIDAVEQKFNKKIDSYVIIAIEKEQPFLINVFELDNEVINFGREEYKFLLAILKECIEHDYFPSYDIPQKIFLPKYIKSKIERSNEILINSMKFIEYKQTKGE